VSFSLVSADMSTRKASTARPEPAANGPASNPATGPDVVQQLLAERRELKVANERLRIEIEDAKRLQGKPDRRLTLLEEENRRLRQELAAARAENERLIEGVALAVEGLERAAAQGTETSPP
jgi:predicted RNase H-like nuclease (RuvC/YqgF family)